MILLGKYPPNLWRVEHARSTQVFLLRGMLGTTLRETLIIYLMTQEFLLSTQWVVIKLMFSHTWNMNELSFMVVMVTITKFLSKSTMHRFFMYQMATPRIQVNVNSNVERLNPSLCTMMRPTLMQTCSLPIFHHLLNQWNLVVKRFFVFVFFLTH